MRTTQIVFRVAPMCMNLIWRFCLLSKKGNNFIWHENYLYLSVLRGASSLSEVTPWEIENAGRDSCADWVTFRSVWHIACERRSKVFFLLNVMMWFLLRSRSHLAQPSRFPNLSLDGKNLLGKICCFFSVVVGLIVCCTLFFMHLSGHA